MTKWKPTEIIVDRRVQQDPVTARILGRCPGARVTYVDSGRPEVVTSASTALTAAPSSVIGKYLAGKRVLYIGPARGVVDRFEMPDARMVCPEFERLKLASNGCPYRCIWCYLIITYRTVFPYITVRAEYDKIEAELERWLPRPRLR